MRLVPALSLATVGLGFHASASLAQSDDEWRTDFSNHIVPLAEIVSGGPPKDGIPAIDDPRFVSVREADRWLDAREPVMVVSLGGETRAYPLQILIWHEIVNDVVGGTPLVVTYCPLCNTALAFDRRVLRSTLDFGTTGRLRHSDLVMYDRQTESWWQQATGEGIVGTLAGRQLEQIDAPLAAWQTVRTSHPQARVLSRDTGYDREYGRNPYLQYDDPEGGPWRRFFSRRHDDRLPAMERVVTVRIGTEAAAYPFSALEHRPTVDDVVGGTAIVVFWTPGTASAVDAATIADGRAVGSSGVFRRRVGSRTLTFEPATDGHFRDRESGTLWNVFGHAIGGPLAGTRLEPVVHGNHFWFSWAVFRPDTRIVR